MKHYFLSTIVVIALLSGCIAVPSGSTETRTSTPIVVVPVAVKQTPQSVFSCRIKAFTSEYTAEDVYRGKAMLHVKKQCVAEHHEMFCQDEYITCKEYH